MFPLCLGRLRGKSARGGGVVIDLNGDVARTLLLSVMAYPNITKIIVILALQN